MAAMQTRRAVWSGVAAAAAAAGGATAGVQTQSIAIDIDSDRGEFGTPIVFNQFDTMGGTRVLTGVNLRYDATLSVDVTAQSYTDRFIASSEWAANVFHNVLVSFFEPGGGGGDGEEGELAAPFYGLGGIGITGFTGDLTPGVPGTSPFDPGIPGDPITASISDTINSVVATDPFFFDYFTGGGTVEGFGGPFVDITLEAPFDAFIEVFAARTTQLGTLSLDYEFSVVPAPAGVAALGIGGLFAARRRR